MESGQGKDPNDENPIASGPDHEPVSQDQAWGTRANPVREEALPAKNLREVG